MTNAAGERSFVKYHFKTKQGIRNLSSARATALAGSDPDHAQRDLFDAIARKDYPRWSMEIQVMPEADAVRSPINPFDVPLGDRIGRLTELSERLMAADGVDHVDASLTQVLENKFYADSNGTMTTQQRVRLHPDFTVVNVDRVIVIDQGRILAAGRHEQLLRSCEFYRQLIETQLVVV
jgi:predicted Zn-dependent protease